MEGAKLDRQIAKLSSRRRGFALAMVLGVILVGTALTAVAFYLADSAHLQTDQAAWYAERFNAAQGGIIEGQRWLHEEVQRGIPPRWDGGGDSVLTAAKLATFRTLHPGSPSEDILDLSAGVSLGALSGITRSLKIFDLGYESEGTVPFSSGLLPALAASHPREGTLDRGDDYQGGIAGSATVEREARRLFYLLRSTASRDDGGATVLELALRQPVQ